METQTKEPKLEIGLFKIDDDVTIIDDFEGNEYFKGQPGKIVKFEIEECTNRDPKRCIWVNLPEVKNCLFNSHHDSSVPEAEKKWVCFFVTELRLGHKPKTQKQIIDDLFEKSQAHSASVFNEPADGTCLVKGCNNFASGYGVYNACGQGNAFKGCAWHIKQYSTWCDPNPFEPKTEGLIRPPWLEEDKKN